MLHLCDDGTRQTSSPTGYRVVGAPREVHAPMQYDNSDDPFGFWNDEPTRPLRRTHGGTRSHGDPAATTRMIPVVRSERARPPAPTRPPRNPLVTRIGLLVGVMLLFVPIALSLRSSKTHLEASGLHHVGTVSIGHVR